MKPFNLALALDGNPLIDLYDNEKVWLIGSSRFDEDQYVLENEEGDTFYVEKSEISKGYGMWIEPTKQIQITIPAPLKSLENRNTYWTINLSSGQVYEEDSNHNIAHFKAGFGFANEEDAKQFMTVLQSSKQ